MDNTDKKQRQLSKEAKELVKSETRKEIDENMEYIKEKFVEILTDHIFTIKEVKKKAILEDKESMAEYVLNKYIPIKKKLNIIKNTLLTTDEQKEGEEKFVKNLMESNFEEKTTYYEETLKNYTELEKIFKFIDESINDYIKTSEERIKFLNENNNNENYSFDGKQIELEISKIKRKMYILEKRFREGQPAKTIKLALYENERRYAYDYKEVLQEMSEYFTTYFTIIDVFS